MFKMSCSIRCLFYFHRYNTGDFKVIVGYKYIKSAFPRINASNVVPADILRAVLSLYLCDSGQDLPLPGSDEVLLCTEHTTAEEVSCFYWNNNNDGQITAKNRPV